MARCGRGKGISEGAWLRLAGARFDLLHDVHQGNQALLVWMPQAFGQYVLQDLTRPNKLESHRIRQILKKPLIERLF